MSPMPCRQWWPRLSSAPHAELRCTTTQAARAAVVLLPTKSKHRPGLRRPACCAMHTAEARPSRHSRRSYRLRATMPRDTLARESWACRSTVGAVSDCSDSDGGDSDDGSSEREQGASDSEDQIVDVDDQQGDACYGLQPKARQPPPSTDIPPIGGLSKKAPKLQQLQGFRNGDAMLRRLPAPINVVPSQTGPASSKTMETKKLNPIEPKVIDKKMDKKVDKKGKANPDQMTINVQAWPQPQHGPRRFTIAPLLVYSILFSSTATLQCAVLNFQFELRRLLRMDTLPVSMLLLVCWAVTGIATLAGGVVGDLVTDRVVLLRRSMPLWAAGLSGFQVASFKVPVPVYVFSLTCAFIWSWAAHGLFVGNAFLLATDDSSSSAVASASRPHLACCLAAMAMGSTLVQVVFFSLVDIRTLAPSADEGILNTSGVGFGCMLLLSVLLLATLVGFERRAWHYKPSRMDKLERKMALASRAVLGWRDMHQVYRHRGVRCVAVLAVCLLVLGVLLSFVSVFLNATPWKLAPFLLIVIGWLLALLMTKSLITPSEAVQTKCDDLGVPVRQMTRGFLTLVFVGIAAFAAFVRAQFYSTLLTQVCQTRLQFPGGHLRLDPRLLGALATTWSFVVLPMAEVWRTRYVHRHKPSLAWLAHSAHTPVDFRISTLLWLVGLFFASVVELYRRSSRHLAPPRDGNCGKMASVEFSFLWAVPHVLLLGAADACFRLSFHDELQALATRTTMPGLIHGLAALADTIGNASALAQASMLSSWLFRPEPTDLALLLLLTTAGAALAYSLLRRALAQAEDDDDDENHADECETP